MAFLLMLLLLVLGFVVYFQLPCIFVLCRIQLSFIHASVLCVTPRLEITHHSQCNCNVTHRSSIAQFCTQKIKLIFLAYIYLYIVWNDNFRITLHTNRFHSIKTWRCFQFICDRWWNMDNIVVMTQSLLTQHNIFFFCRIFYWSSEIDFAIYWAPHSKNNIDNVDKTKIR